MVKWKGYSTLENSLEPESNHFFNKLVPYVIDNITEKLPIPPIVATAAEENLANPSWHKCYGHKYILIRVANNYKEYIVNPDTTMFSDSTLPSDSSSFNHPQLCYHNAIIFLQSHNCAGKKNLIASSSNSIPKINTLKIDEPLSIYLSNLSPSKAAFKQLSSSDNDYFNFDNAAKGNIYNKPNGEILAWNRGSVTTSANHTYNFLWLLISIACVQLYNLPCD